MSIEELTEKLVGEFLGWGDFDEPSPVEFETMMRGIVSEHLTAAYAAGAAAEQARVRGVLAGLIVETRREIRDGWSVPPEYMLDRIETLREIGRKVRQ